MGFIAFLFLASFFVTCFYALLTITTTRKTTKLPPGPHPLPIIGDLLKLGEKPHESLTSLAKIYGPLMSLKLGMVTTIVVSSSNIAKEVLQKNDQAFANRTVVDAVRAARHAELSMAWLPVCPGWRTLRKFCNLELFTPKRLDANQSLRREKVEQLLSFVQNRCQSVQPVEIAQAAFITSLNLISNTMFSVDLANYNSVSGVQEFKGVVWGIMEEAGKPNLSDYFPLLRPFDIQGIRHRMEIYFGKLDELFDRMIEQRLKSREAGTILASNDFLDTVLDHSQENGGELGYQDIKSLFKDIFVAGTDTSSSTLEWAMAELIHNPNTMAKARLEVNEAIDKGKPIEEYDIVRLPYLQAVVKETLRLHPAFPLLLPRKAEIDVEICGLTVPKNAQLLVNAWAIGRDPETWEKPTLFMPERFLKSNIAFKGRYFELIPFGTGRRICPGLPLAYRMVHLMLASLINSFDWKLEDGAKLEDMDMQERFGLTLQKAKPLRIIPTKM